MKETPTSNHNYNPNRDFSAGINFESAQSFNDITEDQREAAEDYIAALIEAAKREVN